jgi:hypothetical protein|tara:strand:+ start:47 stop:187 length:141 start_codon:yes stop_codon:yes gene_type:complete
MAEKKKAAAKKDTSKPGIEDRYKKELPPKWTAKYKAMVMAGLIKEK